jgi:hypothetical protein
VSLCITRVLGGLQVLLHLGEEGDHVGSRVLAELMSDADAHQIRGGYAHRELAHPGRGGDVCLVDLLLEDGLLFGTECLELRRWDGLLARPQRVGQRARGFGLGLAGTDQELLDGRLLIRVLQHRDDRLHP